MILNIVAHISENSVGRNTKKLKKLIIQTNKLLVGTCSSLQNRPETQLNLLHKRLYYISDLNIEILFRLNVGYLARPS